MTLYEWFPAFTTTTLTLGALWLLRRLILVRLTKSVSHQFNEKLELLKADLKSKETEISILRNGALSAMESRQIAVDKRRLEAIDQLWTSFNSYNGARLIATTLRSIDFKKAAEHSKSDIKTRQFFETLGNNFDPKSLDNISAAKAKPFVSAMAWATYVAYSAICMHAVLRMHTLSYGLGTEKLIDDEAVKKLIIVALPSFTEYLEEFGSDSYHYILDSLESKLLQEIQLMLSGVESDQSSIRQSAEILKKSNAVLQQVNNPVPN